jgi:uroporphyrinogen-III decarboxylase
VDQINRKAELLGGRGILRGAVPGFEIYGQPGCWQDAAVLYGIVELITETYDDPAWVNELLEILKVRKLASVASMEGARLDLIELGGGDASSTVISPKIFDEFVAPYDSELIAAAHRAGQKVVYHTCGGMMPLLEQIADMGTDAMETFTPPTLGGDADLEEAKRRIGDRVCMVGGFDQCSFFQGCEPADTRRAVRRCFAEAGDGGGYILAPSDHFFDADVELIKAFADEARSCVYDQ